MEGTNMEGWIWRGLNMEGINMGEVEYDGAENGGWLQKGVNTPGEYGVGMNIGL